MQTQTANQLAILKSRFQAGDSSGHRQTTVISTPGNNVAFTYTRPYFPQAAVMPNGQPIIITDNFVGNSDTNNVVFVTRYRNQSYLESPQPLWANSIDGGTTPANGITPPTIETFSAKVCAVVRRASDNAVFMRYSADNGVTWTASASLGFTVDMNSYILRTSTDGTRLYLFYGKASDSNVYYRSTTTGSDPTTNWSAEFRMGLDASPIGNPNTGNGGTEIQNLQRRFYVLQDPTTATRWHCITQETTTLGYLGASFHQYGQLNSNGWVRGTTTPDSSGYFGDSRGGISGGGKPPAGFVADGTSITYLWADDSGAWIHSRTSTDGVNWGPTTDEWVSATAYTGGVGGGINVPKWSTPKMFWYEALGDHSIRQLARADANPTETKILLVYGQPIGGSASLDVSDRVISLQIDKSMDVDSDQFNLVLHNEDAALNVIAQGGGGGGGSGYSAAVIADAPLGYWRMGEVAGTVMADSSGNSRNGTYNGTYALNQTSLVSNDTSDHSLLVQSGYGQVAANAAFNRTTSIAVELIYFASSGQGGLINKPASENSYNDAYELFLDSGTMYWRINGTFGQSDLTYVPSATAKHHAVGEWDGTTQRLYLDGVLVASKSTVGTMAGGSASVRIGHLAVGFYSLTGRLDEVAIYSDLSAARVAAHSALALAPVVSSAGQGLNAWVVPNNKVTISQWYGTVANSLVTFSGILDAVAEHDTPHTVACTGRDYAKHLIVQEIVTTGPQIYTSTEPNPVRTPANAVYVTQTFAFVITHLLTYWGNVDPAKVAVTASPFVIKDLVFPDGTGVISAIKRVCDMAGQVFWVDELGYYRTAPIDQKVASSVYTFGKEELTAIDVTVDDDSVYTRVRVLGKANIGAKYLTESKVWPGLSDPRGIATDPTDGNKVWYLDGAAGNLYKLDADANMAVVSGPLALSLGFADSLCRDSTDGNLWVVDGLNSSLTTNAGRVYKKINKVTGAIMIGPFTTPGGGLHCRVEEKDATHLIFTGFSSPASIYTTDKANNVTSTVTSPVNFPMAISLDGQGGLFISGQDQSDIFQLDFAGNIVNRIASPAKDPTEFSIDTSLALYSVWQPYNSIVYFTVNSDPQGVPTATLAEAYDATLETLLGEKRIVRITDLSVVDKASAQWTANRQLSRLKVYKQRLTVGITANPGLQKNDRVTVVVPSPGSTLNGDWVVVSIRSSQDADHYQMNLVLQPYIGAGVF